MLDIVRRWLMDMNGEFSLAEEQLRKLSRAVEQSASGIIITDLDGTIEFVNPAFTEITGYTAQEVAGKTPRILKSNQNSPELYEQLWAAITQGQVWQGELVNKKKNGELYWEFATVSPVKDKTGRTTHYLAVKEDISQRKKAEETLQKRNRQLALINRASQIFSSTLELDEVIQIILREMHRLLNIEATSYWLRNPDTGELVCEQASGPGNDRVIGWRLAPGQGLTGRSAESGRAQIVADMLLEPEYFEAVDRYTGLKLRSLMTIPLRAKGEVIGVLNLADTEVGRFSQDDISLLEPIAAVAASAIKNAQLFRETQRQRKIAESLRQVTAIISSSLDLDTVLDKIFEQLRRVIHYDGAGLFLHEDDALLLVGGTELVRQFIGNRVPLDGSNITVEPFMQKKSITVADIQTEARWIEDWPQLTDPYTKKVRGWMGAPLLRDDQAIGVLTVDSFEMAMYTERDAQILRTFANQAAIAIQNARQAQKTQAALHETQILYRISSILSKTPDVQTGVTAALAEFLAALNLKQGGITLLTPDKQSGKLHALVQNGRPQPIGIPVKIVAQVYQEIIKTGQPVAILDALNDPRLADALELSIAHNIKSILLVPLLVRGQVIGLLGADSTDEPRHFTPREIGLAQSIADQIATAIDNASLLEREQQQRKMADSLRQVALALNSSLDQDVVIPKILDQLRNVIHYDSAGLFLADDKVLVLSGGVNLDEQHIGFQIPLDSKIRAAQVFNNRQPIITPDVRKDPYWDPKSTSGLILSWMAAPLLIGDEAIGVLTMDSFELDTYTANDVQVFQTFANHAALAITNARLFKAKQVALEQARTLYRASLALSVTIELQQTIRLILAELHKVLPYDHASVHELLGSSMEAIGGAGFEQISTWTGWKFNIFSNNFANVLAHRKDPVIVDDLQDNIGFQTGPHEDTGARSWIGVSLLFGNRVVGALCLDKSEPAYFKPEHAQVIKAFAVQAAIAVENSRLFKEEQRQRQVAEQRTGDLSQALDQLRATQNQLVMQEKMASLGMLTAGIAHEIKNPLNFVTSFAQLSVELASDLKNLLWQQSLAPTVLAEIDSILRDLQYNATSINEEGQRANSIVQSMLLHSRGGSSSERQSADINALLQEAVVLAFHSMRAKDIEFDISINADYASNLPPLWVVPQNLSRVFVNLVNNAYDATRERKSKSTENFEALLSIATENKEHQVEIRIRDNGMGISPERRAKLFTPFYTTKPAGEGTGLGLSISYDIIVQEHQGEIFVDSQEGKFTEVVIRLPKTSSTQRS